MIEAERVVDSQVVADSDLVVADSDPVVGDRVVADSEVDQVVVAAVSEGDPEVVDHPGADVVIVVADPADLLAVDGVIAVALTPLRCSAVWIPTAMACWTWKSNRARRSS